MLIISQLSFGKTIRAKLVRWDLLSAQPYMGPLMGASAVNAVSWT